MSAPTIVRTGPPGIPPAWCIAPVAQSASRVQIVAEAANSDEATSAIHKMSPDVLFFDVEMLGGSDFQLLEKLEGVPAIIFTTAYDEYAVRAFEVSALGYFGEADHRRASSGGLGSCPEGLGRDS
jgi:two-component system LytT family response regulator